MDTLIPRRVPAASGLAPACVLASIGDLALQMPAEPDRWLGASERQRLAGFSSPARRRSFLAGRWLARQKVGELLGLATDRLGLEIDALGRSRIGAAPAMGLSISHSGDWVACAVAMMPVGLDLEALRPRRDLLALAATVHSPAQCQRLAELGGAAQLLRFYQDWTLKEAWLKRQGLGLDLARMRALDYREAAVDEAAQALSLVDRERGLVLALDGSGAGETAADPSRWPPGFALLQRLRYTDQSTPKSK